MLIKSRDNRLRRSATLMTEVPILPGLMGRWEFESARIEGDKVILQNVKRLPRKDGVVEEEFDEGNLQKDAEGKPIIVLTSRVLTEEERYGKEGRKGVDKLKKDLGHETIEYRVLNKDDDAIIHRVYGVAVDGIAFIREDILSDGNDEQVKEALDHEAKELTFLGHDEIRQQQYQGGLRELITQLSDRDKGEEIGRSDGITSRSVTELQLKEKAANTIILFRKIQGINPEKMNDPENAGAWWTTDPLYYGDVDGPTYELHLTKEELDRILRAGMAVDRSLDPWHMNIYFHELPKGAQLISQATQDFVNSLIAIVEEKEPSPSRPGGKLNPGLKVRSLLGDDEVFNPQNRLYSDWIYRVLKYAADHSEVGNYGSIHNNAQLGINTPGGIDLKADKLNLDVRSSCSAPVEFNLDPAQLQNIQFDGLVPNIITITPMTNLPLFLSGENSSSQLKLSIAK